MGRPYHKVDFENNTYKLRLNSWGAWILDKEHGFRFSKMKDASFEIPEVILIIYASLFDFHEDKATIKMASKLLDELGLRTAIDLVSKLMLDYMPQVKAEEASEEKKITEFESQTGMNS
jgi:hypothetical protein